VNYRSKLIEENRALKSKKFVLEHHLEEINNELDINVKERTRIDTKELMDFIDAELEDLSTNKPQYH